MARALILSASQEDPSCDPWNLGPSLLLKQSATSDCFKQHTLIDNPHQADVIVFAEWTSHGAFAEKVRHHSYVKRFRDKCFIFDPSDYAIPFLPGLYASLNKNHYDFSRTRTGWYLRTDENPYIDFEPMPQEPLFLAGFTGSIQNHPSRRALLSLPKDKFYIRDTSSFAASMLRLPPAEKSEFWAQYVLAMKQAAFSLCPRGVGAGSMRLFESMKMGRAPVILADDWVPNDDVEWRTCSVTVTSRELPNLTEILGERLSEARSLGFNARLEWQNNFGPDVMFHRLVEACIELRRLRKRPERLAQSSLEVRTFTGLIPPLPKQQTSVLPKGKTAGFLTQNRAIALSFRPNIIRSILAENALSWQLRTREPLVESRKG
jgi:Exostosin family